MISMYAKVLVLACKVHDRLKCLLNDNGLSHDAKVQVEQAEKDVSEIVDHLEGRGDKKA